jgi:hypothetical protein
MNRGVCCVSNVSSAKEKDMNWLCKTAVAAAVALVVVGAVAPWRAEAQLKNAVLGAAEKDVLPLLKKAVAKAKDVQITGGMELAQAIIKDGIDGTPKPERSKGKLFPHYLVKTKTGNTYKVKFKKVAGKMTITIAKYDASQANPAPAPGTKSNPAPAKAG